MNSSPGLISSTFSDDLMAEIVRVAEGERNAQWWAGPSSEGETQLTDKAVDWIETAANDER